MGTFYDGIEPQVREIVRLLRDNGWNTTDSCGHEMSVQVDLSGLDDAERIAELLLDEGYDRFEMNAHLDCSHGGVWTRWLDITFVDRSRPSRRVLPQPSERGLLAGPA